MIAVAAVTLIVGAAAKEIKPADVGDRVVIDGVVYDQNAVVGFMSEIIEELSIRDKVRGIEITTINENAFTGCEKIKRIAIPPTVTDIQEKAFAQCKNLTEVIFRDPDDSSNAQDLTIHDSAFQICVGLTTLSFPEYRAVTVNGGAFKDCKELDGVIFWNGTLDENAFALCDNLKTVVLGDSSKVTAKKKSFDSKLKIIHYTGKKTNTYPFEGFYWGDIHLIGGNIVRNTDDVSCVKNGFVEERARCDEIIDKDNDVKCDCEIERRLVIPALGHDWVDAGPQEKTKDPTCMEEGELSTPQKCSLCGEAGKPKIESIPKSTTHKYTDASATEERLLFEGHCADSDKGETPVKSLTLVTKKCSVCGYTPICYICQELELDFKEADAKLETAKNGLESATAKAEAAQKTWEEAEAAQKEAVAERTKASVTLGAANVALIGLKAKEALITTKVTNAETTLKTAQDALDALDPDATAEERAEAEKAVTDAQEALDALKPEEDAIKEQLDAAEKTKEDASLAYDRADIAKNEADTAANKAKTALEEAEDALKKLTDIINNDPGVSNAQEALRNHLKDPKAHWECAECVELIKAIGAAANEEERTKAEDAYTAHEQDPNHNHSRTPIDEGAVSGTEPDKPPEHQYLDPVAEPNGNGEIPECGTGGYVRVTYWQTCKICGHKEKTGKEDIIEAAEHHTPPPGIGSTVTKEPSCTEEGLRVYDDYECVVCHKKDVKGEEEIIPKLEHVWVSAGDKIIKEATCVEEGLKRTGDRECKLCGEVEKGTETVIPRTGHKWGDPVPVNEGKDDKAPTCGDPGTAYVTVTCPVCGTVEKQTIEIPPTGQHEWGEWDRVKEPTVSEEGLQRRECSLCRQVDERAIPALGECAVHDYGPWETVKEPTATEDGLRKRVCKVCGHEDTEKIDATGGGTTTDPDATDYVIECIQTTNGRISAPSSARRGATVSVSFSPDSGYELDQVRVTQTGGAVVNVSGSGSRRTFTMPAAKVEVRATFSRIITSFPDWSDSSSGASSRWTDPSQTAIQGVPHLGASQQLFYDIPLTHWAAGEIGWASQMGYMNGNRWGDFDPDGPMTFQQMWMVLARVNGYWPSNMEDAKRWAVEGGFAEGANPAVAITRHQMVTALFRCARLMGSTNNNFASLAGYADSRTVPASARNAMAWAVANGIIGGTSNGRLEPNQTITRAQFAVILYRFSQRM